MGIKRITGPTVEPLSPEEARNWLRVSSAIDNALIIRSIKSAREQVEVLTNRQLVTATYRLTLRSFTDCRYAKEDAELGWIIELPIGPLVEPDFEDEDEVFAVAYRGEAGAAQVLDPTTYNVDADGLLGIVAPAFGTAWPVTQAQHPHAVTITFRAGFGPAAADVPEGLRQGVGLLLTAAYEERAPSESEMKSVKNLLRMYQVTDYPG